VAARAGRRGDEVQHAAGDRRHHIENGRPSSERVRHERPEGVHQAGSRRWRSHHLPVQDAGPHCHREAAITEPGERALPYLERGGATGMVPAALCSMVACWAASRGAACRAPTGPDATTAKECWSAPPRSGRCRSRRCR
jgi:hypothetical protein